MRFSANLDSLSKIITNAFIIVTLVIFFLHVTSITNTSTDTTALLFVLFPAIIITWGISPQYYLVTDSAVVIKRPLGNINLPVEKIDGITTVDRKDLGMSLRLLGSGGLFGYLGLFTSTVIGKHQRWCTNKENLVLIECKGKKILISPSDPLEFVQNVNRRQNAFYNSNNDQ